MVLLAQMALPPKVVDDVIVASVLLAVIGTLFLAYDLLGRENGPLRWVTLVITCGLVGAIVLGIIATLLRKLFDNAFDLNTTLLFIVLGGYMGFYTVILVELPQSKSRPQIFSRKGSLIGIALGLTFAFIIYYILRGPLEAALTLGVPCAVIASIWQRITWEPSQNVSNSPGVWMFVAWEEPSLPNPPPLGTWKFIEKEPPHSKPHLFSRKRFLLGLLAGFIFWSIIFFIAGKEIIGALLESVPFALICGVISGVWRFINWEPPHSKPHLFSPKGFWTGLVAGYVPWLVFQIWESNVLLQPVSGPVAGFEAMIFSMVNLLFVGTFALATAAAGSIAQYTLWMANRLPHRILGSIGLVLILLATILQAVQPVIELLGS